MNTTSDNDGIRTVTRLDLGKAILAQLNGQPLESLDELLLLLGVEQAAFDEHVEAVRDIVRRDQCVADIHTCATELQSVRSTLDQIATSLAPSRFGNPHLCPGVGGLLRRFLRWLTHGLWGIRY